ncbi:MAG: hypothetical protein H7Y20_03090 [Bryobacteraceae bacterium]|nr:hypothetical protein [Bryobacteraceae bacterium]
MEFRLGDIIDDHCIKCRRLTNHSVVSMVGTEVAKVRCRSCYHEHTYLKEVAPPSRKDLKKAELAELARAEAAAGNNGDSSEPDDGSAPDASEPDPESDIDAGDDDEPVPETAAGSEVDEAPAKPGRSRARKA